MVLKAVIIEDELKGLVNLKQMITLHCPDVEVVGDADGVESGYQLLQDGTNRPDLAFMDINLGDGKAFQLLERLQTIDFDIIFVTAYDQFAMKACEYSSIGYILKPIDPDELVRAVGRVRPRKNARTDERLEVMRQYQQHPNAFEKITIGTIDGLEFIRVRDIIRLEAADNYTHLYLQGGQRITASKTIKKFDELLGPHNFYRVHKGHVINLNYIKKFVKGEGGHLIMDDGKRIDVSRRRRSAFISQLKLLEDL